MTTTLKVPSLIIYHDHTWVITSTPGPNHQSCLSSCCWRGWYPGSWRHFQRHGDLFSCQCRYYYKSIYFVLSELINIQKELLSAAQLQNSSMNSVKICKSIKVIGCLAAKRTLAFSVKTACQVRKTKLLSKSQAGQKIPYFGQVTCKYCFSG